MSAPVLPPFFFLLGSTKYRRWSAYCPPHLQAHPPCWNCEYGGDHILVIPEKVILEASHPITEAEYLHIDIPDIQERIRLQAEVKSLKQQLAAIRPT